MKKYFFLALLAPTLMFIFSQTYGQQQPQHGDEKPANLKVLPKNISHDSLHALMKTYAKSLGVRCGYCHATMKDDPKHLDFASDAKPEKDMARNMMRMTASINKKYLHKFANGHLETITCVTCHMGRTSPIISVDSLARR